MENQAFSPLSRPIPYKIVNMNEEEEGVCTLICSTHNKVGARS